ncbi:unnamed protein product [Leptidea sinapis]|uniref:Uncharacterized protein n=1 Tax=Leptidea sinapis TaxID=189913 RepID=A0A5E4QY50_9NEOP|nr:unnamed protein product [Leptidea sinapis]
MTAGTRNATIKELRQKLDATIYELSEANRLNSKLLEERDVSDIEIREINIRLAKLKNELTELHLKNVDLTAERYSLYHVHHICVTVLTVQGAGEAGAAHAGNCLPSLAVEEGVTSSGSLQPHTYY